MAVKTAEFRRTRPCACFHRTHCLMSHLCSDQHTHAGINTLRYHCRQGLGEHSSSNEPRN